ncbi:kielin/chordin-like protein [Homalodisca vitripennis]|uniref:kielin/chordin-like protein n=1 Tax=Homalodisca vitripennis TaxID=197043 RepID=UPI001EEAA5AC|nr:kielin/chordin-like protein [Homalodisca vitripennis]
MKESVVLSLGFLTLVAGACNEYAKNYYETIGCTPESHDETRCPISYDCSVLSQRSPDKCYFQGRAYDEGDTLQDSPPCLVHCKCEKSPQTGGRLQFSCIRVECPEFFRRPPPPGCYNLYEHDKCCSVGRVCGQQKEVAQRCEYKGQTYNIGEKFYPDEEPCRKCICQPGFNGSFTEPTCRKFSCNYELTYVRPITDGCVPVFYGEKRCCPIEWRCPKDSDSVITQVSKTGPDSGKTCQFGELTLRVGDKLNSQGGVEIECTCTIPPHPLCVRKQY